MVGHITEYDEKRGILTVLVPDCWDVDFLVNKASSECEVTLADSRLITPKQNRAIHAMVRDIATYISGFSDREVVRTETLHMLQASYLLDTEDDEAIRYALTSKFCEIQSIEMFSLSAKSQNAASVTLAREFLTWLIDFAIENGIPCSSSLIDRAEDIGKYLYACAANRTCCICGRRGADIHHTKSVGSGRNRREIAQLGMYIECLCREHHNEAHNIGQQSFDDKYKVFGIALDEKLCDIFKFKKEKE